MKTMFRIFGITAIAVMLSLAFTACEGPIGPEGEPGQQGSSPVISICPDTGNWLIDGENTGVYAHGGTGLQGPQGETGQKGDTGAAGSIVTSTIPEESGLRGTSWVRNTVTFTFAGDGKTFTTEGFDNAGPHTVVRCTYVGELNIMGTTWLIECIMPNGFDWTFPVHVNLDFGQLFYSGYNIYNKVP